MRNYLIYILGFSSVYVLNGQNFDDISPVEHPFTHVERGGVQFADINGDALADVVLFGMSFDYPFTPVLHTYIQESEQSYVQKEQPALKGIYDGDLQLEDLDDDGDLDMIVSGLNENRQPIMTIALNDGKGQFLSVSDEFEGLSQCAIGLLDYNNDGKKDILVSGIRYFEIKTNVYINQGKGQFLKHDHNFSNVYNGDILVGDLNNNGRDDVILSGIDEKGSFITSYFVNQKMTGFVQEEQCKLQPAIRGCIKQINLNGDNLPDLVINGESTHQKPKLTMYINAGDGDFIPLDLSEDIQGSICGDIHVYDFNSDTKDDVLITGWNNGAHISNIYVQNTINHWNIEPQYLTSHFSSIDVARNRYNQHINLIQTGKNSNNLTQTNLWYAKSHEFEGEDVFEDDDPMIFLKNHVLHISEELVEAFSIPEIYDVLGRNRTSEVDMLSPRQIQIQNLPKGTYILRCSKVSYPFTIQ